MPNHQLSNTPFRQATELESDLHKQKKGRNRYTPSSVPGPKPPRARRCRPEADAPELRLNSARRLQGNTPVNMFFK